MTNPKPVAPPALMRHLELMSLYDSEMGLDPDVANAHSLREMSRQERRDLADFLKSLLEQPPVKPGSNRIYFQVLGRLALHLDELPRFLETLDAMEKADRAAKIANPVAKRRHGTSR